jgi:hypothetical protein
LKQAIALFAALTLFAAAAAAQTPSDRKLDDLMHKSGLWNQLGSLAEGLAARFDQKDANASGDKLTPEQAARVRSAMHKAYTADVMRTRVRASLAKHISVAATDSALLWLESDVGRMFTRLEEADSAAPIGTSQGPAAQRLYSVLSTERRDRIEHFSRSKGAGDRSATLVIGMTLAMAQVFTAAKQDDPSGLEQLKRKLEADRPALAKRGFDRAVLGDSYVYRTVSDADLDRYIQFNESPGGKRYNDAMTVALIDALVASAGDAARYAVQASDAAKQGK